MMENETRHVFARMQHGDEEAAREVFNRYLHRLVGLARSRMSERLGQKFDADDVVQSAFRSFFVRARDGQFAIEQTGDLWRLLASITHHKLLKNAEHFRQQKRNLDRDQPLGPGSLADGEIPLTDQPTSEEAVALTDEVEFLMRDLAPLQRTMLELRLQDQPIPEIAEVVQRSERTVRRFLGSFREELEERLKDLREE